MEYITLKNTELNVSRVCMGGCPMGGYGWGKVSEEELLKAINKALDCGVNFFDTADTYGLGKSEITLAKGLGSKRHDVIIESKFGVRTGGGKTVYDNSPDYIRTALEESLKRLNTDYLDIYVIHYRDRSTPIGAVVDELERLKKEGKIRYFGLSNIHASDISELIPYKGKFVSCQDEFSLACRKNEGDLELLRKELLITPMTWGSLGQGVLSGKYGKDAVFGADDRRSREIYVNFHGEKLEKNLKIVDVLKNIAKERNKSVPSCAIRWILDKMPDSVAIVGVKNSSQLVSNVEACDWHLSKDEMSLLEEISK